MIKNNEPCLISNMRMFADDTKIYFVTRNLMTVSDCKNTLTSCYNCLESGLRIGNSVPLTYTMEDSACKQPHY